MKVKGNQIQAFFHFFGNYAKMGRVRSSTNISKPLNLANQAQPNLREKSYRPKAKMLSNGPCMSI